ncbi:MAG: hypothetical protein Ct9H300mP13_8380 [Gammaproteobacteria bacterium]|nr:MAG: hypothetical protein Ct9H300mP13_8380 [Gammaproteobacteria bacterium]
MELRPNRIKRKLANNENAVVVSGPTHPEILMLLAQVVSMVFGWKVSMVVLMQAN